MRRESEECQMAGDPAGGNRVGLDETSVRIIHRLIAVHEFRTRDYHDSSAFLIPHG
jgi:hypothetical protein